MVTLIIITIGASMLLRGLAQLVWDKRIHALPPFSGDTPIAIARRDGAAAEPVGAGRRRRSWWRRCPGSSAARCSGKAMLATSYNRLAAQLVGISTCAVLLASFGLAAVLGAIAGVLIAPITFTSYDIGIMLGLKGFAAAILGGLGSFGGAVAGGLLLGLLESLGAGFVSSAYKDAIAFVIILAVLFFHAARPLRRTPQRPRLSRAARASCAAWARGGTAARSSWRPRSRCCRWCCTTTTSTTSRSWSR